jgi:tetratricopeptide (TPR) repeat protein
VRKPVLPIVAVLAVAAAGFFGWTKWAAYQREARWEAWRSELLAPPPADDPGNGPDDARRAEVIAELKKELKSDPELTGASELLADLLIRMALGNPSNKDTKKLSEAKLVLDDAVKRHPEAIDASLKLAKVCRALGLIDESIKVLNNALVHSEGTQHARVELDLANTCFLKYQGTGKEEDFRAARSGFQNARGDPTTEAEALEGYGALFLENGRYHDFDKVLTTYRELLKKYPAYPNAEKIRGLVEVLSKQPGGG